MPIDPAYLEWYSEHPDNFRFTKEEDGRVYFRNIAVIHGPDQIISMSSSDWKERGCSLTYKVTIAATTEAEHAEIEEWVANPGDW